MATINSTLLIGLVISTVCLGACSSRDTQDGGVRFGNPIFPSTPAPAAFTPYKPSDWQPSVNGAAENPTTPPNECDLPPGFSALYNGHNWLGANGLDRVFPAKNNFCNIQR